LEPYRQNSIHSSAWVAASTRLTEQKIINSAPYHRRKSINLEETLNTAAVKIDKKDGSRKSTKEKQETKTAKREITCHYCHKRGHVEK